MPTRADLLCGLYYQRLLRTPTLNTDTDLDQEPEKLNITLITPT